MRKLNIGCGEDTRKGFINLDAVKLEGVDIVHNLNKYPWPFKDNEFDFINADQVIEHLDNQVKALQELWRITKEGGRIHLGVPHYASPGAWFDLTHKHPFGWMSLDYMAANKIHKHSVGKRHQHEYGQKEKFNIKRKFIFGRLNKLIGISWLAHQHPIYYEMFNLAYLFPPRHIEFDLEVVK
jgi:predicted SAM-dependent methyltransferase